MKLGRVPSRNDPRTLRFSSYVSAVRPSAPPLARDWSREVERFDMFANDRIGCCGIASIAHLLQAYAANTDTLVAITERDVIDAYRVVGSYDPAYPDTDNGIQMIDGLRFWRSTGVARNRCDAYVRLDNANRLQAELAVNLFGGAYIGIDLPRSAQRQTIWDVAPPNVHDANYLPGTWGGHAVAMVGYSRTACVIVTWGQVKLMTWEFYYTYVSEAWVVINDLWSDGSQLSPSGFDRARLDADLKLIASA